VDPAIEEFIERFGLETKTEGLARTAGRVFAYLLVRAEPCSCEELAEELQISRGGVSMSTRYLESRDLVERTGLPGDQRLFYRIPDDPFANLTQNSLERRRRIRDLTREARLALSERAVGTEFGGAMERLTRMESFYDMVIKRMEEGLAAWKAADASRTGERIGGDAR
jgi:DNA-binding transcriptional regulator GbsR (MarR family)